MRILLACPYAWDAPGGVQVHVRELTARLGSRGHETAIVAPARGPVDDVQVRVVGRPVRVPYGGKVAPICFSRRSWSRIRETIRVFEPDVVHVHEPFSPSTSLLAMVAADVPVVATFHAHHERSRALTMSAPVLRSLGRRISAPIAVSEAAAAFAGPALAGSVEVVPNGVDVDRFARPGRAPEGLPGRRRILWVNRLDPQKGFPIMLRAFSRLAAELEDVSLVVAGDGRDREALTLLSERERRGVMMLGTVPNADLPAYLAAADVLAAPATGHESFGLVLVEAMAAGVPVVATDIPGYREVVSDGVEGLLVPPLDPAALAAALRRILTAPELGAALGSAGRRRAEGFSWELVVPRVEAIYHRVAPGAR